MLAPDAAVLNCGTELRRVLDIAAEGGSAARQRRIVAEAVRAGARPDGGDAPLVRAAGGGVPRAACRSRGLARSASSSKARRRKR